MLAIFLKHCVTEKKEKNHHRVHKTSSTNWEVGERGLSYWDCLQLPFFWAWLYQFRTEPSLLGMFSAQNLEGDWQTQEVKMKQKNHKMSLWKKPSVKQEGPLGHIRFSFSLFFSNSLLLRQQFLFPFFWMCATCKLCVWVWVGWEV